MNFTDAVRELINEVKADLAGRFTKFQHERYLKKRGWTEVLIAVSTKSQLLR